MHHTSKSLLNKGIFGSLFCQLSQGIYLLWSSPTHSYCRNHIIGCTQISWCIVLDTQFFHIYRENAYTNVANIYVSTSYEIAVVVLDIHLSMYISYVTIL